MKEIIDLAQNLLDATHGESKYNVLNAEFETGGLRLRVETEDGFEMIASFHLDLLGYAAKPDPNSFEIQAE